MSATLSATIAARSHQNATLAAPVRRAPQPRRASPSRLQRLGGLVGRKPGRAVMLLLFAALAVAILLNATLFQKARHPAPILSSQTGATQRPVERRQEPAATPAASAPASPVSAPLPPSRPSDLVPSPREAAAREAAARESTARESAAPRPPATVAGVARTAPAAAPAPAPVRSAAMRDPIADLINGADLRPPAEIRGVAPARTSVTRRTVEN